jgi:hypothetical protein
MRATHWFCTVKSFRCSFISSISSRSLVVGRFTGYSEMSTTPHPFLTATGIWMTGCLDWSSRGRTFRFNIALITLLSAGDMCDGNGGSLPDLTIVMSSAWV